MNIGGEGAGEGPVCVRIAGPGVGVGGSTIVHEADGRPVLQLERQPVVGTPGYRQVQAGDGYPPIGNVSFSGIEQEGAGSTVIIGVDTESDLLRDRVTLEPYFQFCQGAGAGGILIPFGIDPVRTQAPAAVARFEAEPAYRLRRRFIGAHIGNGDAVTVAVQRTRVAIEVRRRRLRGIGGVNTGRAGRQVIVTAGGIDKQRISGCVAGAGCRAGPDAGIRSRGVRKVQGRIAPDDVVDDSGFHSLRHDAAVGTVVDDGIVHDPAVGNLAKMDTPERVASDDIVRGGTLVDAIVSRRYPPPFVSPDVIFIDACAVYGNTVPGITGDDIARN